MKLVVIIPAFNEEKSLPGVIAKIPRELQGIGRVEVGVVDDGSTDQTAAVAKESGADWVERHTRNVGLAKTFQAGVHAALAHGADVIVNLDADGQYEPSEIPALIQPILEAKADIVLTDRNVGGLEHMPWQKKIGNRLATWITRLVSGFPVRDAQSGFRAFSREAALRLQVLGSYTYVQETILQAREKGLSIAQVECTFYARKGKSRLIPNVWAYARRAGITLLRTFIHYKPLQVFGTIGFLLLGTGGVLGLRVLVHFLETGQVSPFIPTAILSTLLILLGFQILLLGLLGDAIYSSRRLHEEALYLEKKRYFESKGKGA